MTIAIYPGSFTPWHDGHEDVLLKALSVFDKVVVAQGVNPDKSPLSFKQDHDLFCRTLEAQLPQQIEEDKVELASFSVLLVEFASKIGVKNIVRGLRNGYDLEYESQQLYWNEDIAQTYGWPTLNFVYFMCHRGMAHWSSSAIRGIRKFKPDFLKEVEK